MPRPDVAMISPYPTLRAPKAHPSGVATYSSRLADALAEEGATVHVIAPRVEGELDFDRKGRVSVERSFSTGVGALPRAALRALSSGAGVVHVQHEVFLFGGQASVADIVPALAGLRIGRAGTVVTMHQVVKPASVDRQFTDLHRVSVPAWSVRLGLGALQKAISGLAQSVVVHDESFRELLPRASVVRLGVDVVDGDRPRAKARLGLDPGKLTLLCFGYLAPYKGLEVALAAADIAGDAVELVVAGGDHPRLTKDDYGAQLRRRYGRSARFVGYVADEDVAAWFEAADALVLPYPRPFSTSGPYAIAIGSGTPVLCSAALAQALSIPSACVVPMEPSALAARFVELARDPRLLAELRQVMRQGASGRSWQEAARGHLRIYEEVRRAHGTLGRSLRAGKPRGRRAVGGVLPVTPGLEAGADGP